MNYQKLLLTLCLCCLYSLRSNAQLGEYSFSQTTSTYTALTTPNIPLDTIGTSGSSFYRRAYQVQLPFTFTLGNISSDSVWIDLGGFCALKRPGTLPTPQFTTASYFPLSQMPYYTGMIAPMAGSFMVTTSNGLNSNIRTDVSGTSPNRIFTIEWTNLHAQFHNVEVVLHESTNVIDFCYGVLGTTQANIEIGLRLVDTNLFNGNMIGRTNYKIIPGTNTIRYSRVDSTVPLMNIQNRTVLDYLQVYATIPNNLKFTWTPPLPCNLSTANLQIPDTIRSICAGQNVLLTPTGFTSGLSYQWQVSMDSSTWTNVTDGTGATNFQYRTARYHDTLSRWYRLQATCTASSQTVSSNVVKVKGTAILPPYFEGFENLGSDGMIPGCFKIDPLASPYTSTTSGWLTHANYPSMANHGNGYIGVTYGQNNWAYTPGIFLEPNKQYRFTHYFMIDPYLIPGDSARIGIGSLPTPDSITTVSTFALNPLPNNTPYQPLLTNREMYRRMETVFTVPTAGIYFGGIKRNGSGTMDDIEIMELPQRDVMIDTIFAPAPLLTACYNDSVPVTIKVTNAGTLPLSNIPVYFRSTISSGAAVTSAVEMITQTIAPGASIHYTFTQRADISLAGNFYKIIAWSTLPADTYSKNDTSYTVSLQANNAIVAPYMETFEFPGLPNPSIQNILWQGNVGVYTLASTTNTTKLLRTNFSNIPTNKSDSVNSVTVRNVQPNSFLQFKYRMANSNGNTASMAANDTIFVVGISNCGEQRDTLMKIDSSMQTSSSALVAAPVKSLQQFQGERLRIYFITHKLSSATNFYFDIDSFQIAPLPPIDMAALSVRAIPTTVCAGDAVPVKIAVKNNGGLDATGFAVKAMINGQPSSLNYTYTGTLLYGHTDTIAIGNLPFGTTTGTQQVSIYVQQTNDTTNNNDTLHRIVYVVNPPVAAPSLDSNFCDTGMFVLSNPDSTTALWYSGPLATDTLQFIGNTRSSIVASDTFSVVNKRFVPLAVAAPNRGVNSSVPAINNGYGLQFNALSDFVLDSVGVYPSGTGSITLEVVSCISCTQPASLGTRTYNFTNANGTDKIMVPVKIMVPAGDGYAIRLKNASGITGLARDFPFTGFPLSAANWPLTVTQSVSAGSTYDYYYYFYDWKVQALSSCAAPAAAIAAIINHAPVANFNAAVSGNNITTTNLSSGGGSYSWTFGDGGSSNVFAPTHTYSTPGTYSVKLVQTNDCGSDSVTKIVTIVPNSISNIPQGWSKLVLWPNPASDHINVSFTAEKADHAVVSLVDGTGRTVLQQTNFEIKPGINLIRENISGIAPGTYWLTIATEHGKVNLVVTKLN